MPSRVLRRRYGCAVGAVDFRGYLQDCVTPPWNDLFMALATFSEVPPNMFSGPGVPVAPAAPVAPVAPVVKDGLAARVSSLIAALSSLVGELDPGLLSGRDATLLYRDLAHLERLVAAGKTLLAPRIVALTT